MDICRQCFRENASAIGFVKVGFIALYINFALLTDFRSTSKTSSSDLLEVLYVTYIKESIPGIIFSPACKISQADILTNFAAYLRAYLDDSI